MKKKEPSPCVGGPKRGKWVNKLLKYPLNTYKPLKPPGGLQVTFKVSSRWPQVGLLKCPICKTQVSMDL